MNTRTPSPAPPQGHASYDVKPVVGRVIHQLRAAVASLHRENQSQVRPTPYVLNPKSETPKPKP